MGLGNGYQNVIEQIKEDAEDSEQILTDETLITNIKKQLPTDSEYDRRNHLYSDLLAGYHREYQSKSRWKKWYKLLFFVITILCFLGIIIASLYAILLVAKKGTVNVYDLGTVLGSATGLISALIILPKIIAEHLFPLNEESYMIEMVKNMQLNDSNIRKFLRDDKNN